MMDIGKVRMVVPKRLVLMLVHMRFYAVPVLSVIVLMVFVVLV